MTHRRLFLMLMAVIAGTAGVTPDPVAAAVTAAAPGSAAAVTEVRPAPVQAPVPVAAGLPVARPTATDLGVDADVDDVLHVGPAVWVSHDDAVDVFAADGTLTGTLTLSGAGDLALAPDGGRVFVTTGSAIAVYDATTRDPLATWTDQPCPSHPAPLGDRLYYAYGCPGTGPYGLAALDLTAGTATGTGIADVFTAPPLLLTGGQVLVAVEDAGTVTARSYLREGDGTITTLASRTVAAPTDAAVSPDGAELLLATGAEIQRLDTAELQPLGTVTPGGTPIALAWSPDGSRFGLGLAGSSTDQLQVRTAAGRLVSRSALRSAATGAANPAVLPGSLGFSADGTLLRALVHQEGEHLTLLAATALPVAPTVVTLRLISPRRYADPVRLLLVVPGRPSTAVRLMLTDITGSYPFEPASTDAGGVLAAPVDLDRNGRISAAVAADQTHGPGASVATFSVPADFEIGLSGHSGAGGGVLRFKSFARIRGLASGLPARRFQVQLSIQALTRRGWRPAAPVQTAKTDSAGLLGITVGEFDPGVRYRLMVRFPGDKINAATIAYSVPFQVG